MSQDTSDYNLRAIRELLLAAFTAQDLRRFCLDDPRFHRIYDRFGPKQGLDDMVDEVIDHCRTHDLWPEFLAAVQQIRPDVYARYEKRLRIPASPPPAPPSPPSGPDTPAANRLLLKSVLGLAIGALILVAGYWLYVHNPPPLGGRGVTPTAYDLAPQDTRVAILTAHNRYVTAMGGDYGWELRAETGGISDCEKFTLLCHDDGQVTLQTCHKTEEGEDRVVIATDEGAEWVLKGETGVTDFFERFTILDLDAKVRPCLEVVASLRADGQVKVAFRTWHLKEGKHRLVTAMGADWDWVLRAETNQLRGFEQFTMTLLR